MRLAWLLLILPAFAPGAEIEVLGQIESRNLSETSGIAVSGATPGVIWAINDSGNGPFLRAMSTTGSDLGFVRLQQARNIDWEDLAAFSLDGEHYLLVADTGDNNTARKVSWLYIVAEPRPGEDGRFSGDVALVSRLPFRYEDGSHDCEAIAVDVEGDRILLITKRETPAAVYELPLTLIAMPRRPLEARRIASAVGLPRPSMAEMLESPLLGPWRHQPTAADLSPDGRTLALLTYRNVYLYTREGSERWSESLARTPRQLPLPRLAQFEAVAFSGEHLVVVAEGAGEQVLRIGPLDGAEPPL